MRPPRPLSPLSPGSWPILRTAGFRAPLRTVQTPTPRLAPLHGSVLSAPAPIGW